MSGGGLGAPINSDRDRASPRALVADAARRAQYLPLCGCCPRGLPGRGLDWDPHRPAAGAFGSFPLSLSPPYLSPLQLQPLYLDNSQPGN